MGYIHDNLLHDEKVIYWTRVHWIVFAPSAFLAVFSLLLLMYLPGLLNVLSGFIFYGISLSKWIALLVFFLAVFHGLKAYIMYRTSEYGITDKRILMKIGWIQRRSIEIFLDKIEAIYVDQSITGRIFTYGTVTIVGTGGTKDPFLFVPAPLQFRKQAQEQIDAEESKRQRS